MSTEVYGASDDLIEFDGDFSGEMSSDNELVRLSDGTLLRVRYGKRGNGGIWHVVALEKGELFERIDECDDDEADRYSDTAHFRDGITGAWTVKKWRRVK